MSARTLNDTLDLLWEKTEETIDLGIRRRLLSVEGPTERVLETLFFYPLVDKLWNLSQRLKKNNS